MLPTLPRACYSDAMIEVTREDRESLVAVVYGSELEQIPRALARALGRTSFDASGRLCVRGIIRRWAEYADSQGVTPEPISIRYHVPRFAAEAFGHEGTPVEIHSVDLDTLACGDAHYSGILSQATNPEILTDPHVAIFGGVARTALKLHCGVDVATELPLHDVDAVISAHAGDLNGIVQGYGIDISGARVVDGEISDKLIAEILGNVDCTMNEAMLYGGRLYYTQRALEDIRAGVIRMNSKNDPLFGSGVDTYPDGDREYLRKTAFYRGLSFLTRGIGQSLRVSQENLDREVSEIKRYWLVMLLVKLAPMRDSDARYRAIGHWHDIALRLGATGASTPNAFLDELFADYPGTCMRGKQPGSDESQARWITEKLVVSGLDSLRGPREVELPDTYTPADITLADSFPTYDIGALEGSIEQARRRATV